MAMGSGSKLLFVSESFAPQLEGGSYLEKMDIALGPLLPVATKPPILWHYTDGAGFKGVITNKEVGNGLPLS